MFPSKLSPSVIKVERSSRSNSNFMVSTITVVPGRVRFNQFASNHFRIADYKYVDLFVDVANKLLGIKLLKDGDPEKHYALYRIFPSRTTRNPILSFSSSKVLRLFGVAPVKRATWDRYVFPIVESENSEVDFWVNFNQPLLEVLGKDNTVGKITETEMEIPQNTMVSSRFRKCAPMTPTSRVRGGENETRTLDEPMVRINKIHCTFNKSARNAFALEGKRGVEVFLDLETNQMGMKFHKDKNPQCYTLTQHFKNSTVCFTWWGILRRLGLDKTSHGFKDSLSLYLKLLPAPKDCGEEMDCIVDLTPVVEKYGKKKMEGLRPVRQIGKG